MGFKSSKPSASNSASVAGAYILYEETWVGTGKEMLALFMFAFGLDLTVDNVVGAFKKLKLPEIG